MKKIGVLGGMGPKSTVLFYKELIRQCQIQYGAVKDGDFPEIIIYSLPTPDMVTGLEEPEELVKILIQGLKDLERFGVDFIVIPCNTVHLFFKELQGAVKIPILSIIEETAKKVKLKKVGILATDTTLKTNIYQNGLKKYGIEAVEPKESLTGIIMGIKSGKDLGKIKQKLIKIIEEFEKGAIIACTDIPVVLKQEDTKIKLFDSSKILAESAIKYCRS